MTFVVLLVAGFLCGGLFAHFTCGSSEKKIEWCNKRVFELSDKKDYGICSPPIEPQVFMDECHRLKREDKVVYSSEEEAWDACNQTIQEELPGWYDTMPQSPKQVLTTALFNIEMLYYRKWRKNA